ncbi:MAG TPA: MBL fold metallo-hydrolase [Gammaproteobacteria bacterium]|nr:MBL fold metallo-hydrolase [Gammaproteobacteria bacterium]
MLIFRQLFDKNSFTYTYLLGDSKSREAVIIDTVYEQSTRDCSLIDELGLQLIHVVDTHCHADHVTGAWLMKHHLDAKINISRHAGVEGADNGLVDGDHIKFGSRYLQVRETPGHTSGCVTYVLDDETMAFTGDALLVRGCGRTDFQQGSPSMLYQSIKTKILTLPNSTKIYPAHDYDGVTVTSVAEEKEFNPRVGGQSSQKDFVLYMNSLGLPHPGKIDVALPANLNCGRPKNGRITDELPMWGPLKKTFAGVWEIDAEWVLENLSEVLLLDVREHDEFEGSLGHIVNAKQIALGSLANRVGEIDTQTPVVTVCRSGARSAQAIFLLQQAGVTKAANLSGGMLRWRDRGYPVVGGAS